ncbi:MAG: DUF488 domain-containing protein [Candidatus Saccharimonadales bacterium]
MTIYTIGHSTRELDELISILKHYGISQLVDVRTMPRSRHTPQFNEDNLTQELPKHDIQYIHLEKLGGLRHTTKSSINMGWHNTSFRGYADYMQTPDFAAGIDELLVLAKGKTTTIMCAEAVPWRCHRSMIGDSLIVRGYDVKDIFNENKTQDEKLTSFAVADGQNITYPESPLTTAQTSE